MLKDKRQALLDVVILQGVKQETLRRIEALALTFPERNKRYEPKAGELALLLSGSAKISRQDGGKVVLLNRMQPGECIGLASLYSDACPDTVVTFYGGACILVIPRYLVEELIEEDATLSRNVIAALSRKVRFLNTKIAGYTASGSGEKLYRYLLTLPKDENNCVQAGESMASLARRLGIGRASLYRAIDALVQEGKIEKTGQKYKLLSLDNKEEQ